MDEWGIDVTVGASQKGLMMPPGIGIVAAGEKALSATKESTMPRLYWDWKTRLEAEHYRKFCGTAPQLMVFGMREALNMLFEEGFGRRNACRCRGLGAGWNALSECS